MSKQVYKSMKLTMEKYNYVKVRVFVRAFDISE